MNEISLTVILCLLNLLIVSTFVGIGFSIIRKRGQLKVLSNQFENAILKSPIVHNGKFALVYKKTWPSPKFWQMNFLSSELKLMFIFHHGFLHLFLGPSTASPLSNSENFYRLEHLISFLDHNDDQFEQIIGMGDSYEEKIGKISTVFSEHSSQIYGLLEKHRFSKVQPFLDSLGRRLVELHQSKQKIRRKNGNN